MNPFSQPGADVYVPDGRSLAEAAARVTHLGIGAHQDDLEFMAYQGIVGCFNEPGLSFGGVTCTNGSGSARMGPFADCTDAQMCEVRREEQREAARVGQYGFIVQLDHPTAALKSGAENPLTPDLERIFELVRPQMVFTHNPADKHETHLHVLTAVLESLRALPREARPERVFGCEVWRGLDWMNDDEKVAFDVSARPELAATLNKTFASQIAGGKRYDLAIEGRRRANATFFVAHEVDQATHLAYAMDLTPLVHDETLDLLDFTLGAIDRFRADVASGLKRALRRSR